MASLKFFGHSSFLLSMAGRAIVVDPWFNPKPPEHARYVPASVRAEDIKKADLVFVTHEHYDHCDPYDVSTLATRCFSHVIAPQDALAKFNISQRQKIAAVKGDKFNYLGIDVDVVDAAHPQSTYPVGYVIGGEGKRVYFAGDTYDFYAMSQIQCDVAVLPIGGTYTMDVIGAITALKKLRPRYVVPCHYGTFPKIQADPDDFARRVRKETKAEPVVLSPGQSFEF